MIFPKHVRQRQAEHPLCRQVHPTHIGIDRSIRGSVDRPEGSDTHILIFCLGGQGFVRSGGLRTTVPTGHVLLVPAMIPHEYGAVSGQSWSINWLHFGGEQASHYFTHITQTTLVMPIATEQHNRILELYQELFLVSTNGFEVQNLVHGAQVLAHLLGTLFFVPDLGRETISGNAIRTMNENLNTQLSLEDLASDAGLSRAHFSVVFKRETGFSPIDYFNHQKIRRACRLLDDPTCHVGEVGQKVGIPNIHYFSRLFSNIMGMSPTAYRRLPRG